MKNVAILVLLSLVTVAVSGQFDAVDDFVGSSHADMIAIYLLAEECVQVELRLSNEQVREIEASSSQYWRTYFKRDSSVERIAGTTDAAELEMQRLIDEAASEALNTLEPEQRSRLNEILIQREVGYENRYLGLNSELLRTQLEIDDAQLERITTLSNQIDSQLWETLDELYEQVDMARDAAREQTIEGLIEILTDDQREEYERILGEPFVQPILH